MQPPSHAQPPVRTLAILEGIVGQFYMAMLVASLVGPPHHDGAGERDSSLA
jgi:hypothetical protein